MIAGPAAKRSGQAALLLAALALWGGSRLVWVEVTSANGLGQPRTTQLTGGGWSSALVPLALLLLAAAVATIVLRPWQLKALTAVVAAASAVMGYLAISWWVVRDVAVRAARLTDVPVADLVRADRHPAGAVLVLIAGVLTLAAAVLLLRSPAAAGTDDDKYAAPARRRQVARDRQLGAAPAKQTSEPNPEPPSGQISERMMWDALDEGRDPTTPDKGR